MRPESGVDGGEPGLCDLHVGIDREAERSDGSASEGWSITRMIAAGSWDWRKETERRAAVCDGLDDHGGFGQHLYLSVAGERRKSACLELRGGDAMEMRFEEYLRERSDQTC